MERILSNEIPQEVCEEIFKRLTYKNLARLRCVCKNWNAFLKDRSCLSVHAQNFVTHHSGADNVLLRLAFPTILGNGFESYSLHSLSAMEDDPSAVEIFRPKFNMLSTKFRISGQCNGILCLTTSFVPHSLDVLLYNPATRECKWLPDSEMRNITRFSDTPVGITVGIGYDSVTDDYKVIRVWKMCLFTNDGRMRRWYNQVEEYSLRNNSWEGLVKTKVEDFDFLVDSFALFFKRTYYWWALRPRDNRTVILQFNMNRRVFQLVQMPANLKIDDAIGTSLTFWHDTISLICTTDPAYIHIWYKNESKQGRWTKMRRIIHPEVSKPLIFWKGYKELLLEMSDGKVKSYDIDTKEIKDVKVEGDPIKHLSQAVNYEATTVSLGEEATYLL